MVSQNAIIAALSSTALISLAPNVLLLLFPRYASGEGAQSSILALGQAMGAGGLLGDVFLHTIPHANGGGDVGLWILLGFTIFLVADMLLRWVGGGHSHDHSEKGGEKKGGGTNRHHEEMKTSAILLNLAADAMHNFTDGLAIGASFAITTDPDASVLSLLKSRGGIATLSILCHEIPHELSDFAILVRNGYSKKQAIMAQFGTAVAAMAGTVVAIVLEGFAGEALIYITAGGFVYLAACTILPELLEEKATLPFRLQQLMFFLAGIAFLYAVGWLEEMDGGHVGHSHGHHQHAHPQEHVHHIPPVEHLHDHHRIHHHAEQEHHYHDMLAHEEQHRILQDEHGHDDHGDHAHSKHHHYHDEHEHHDHDDHSHSEHHHHHDEHEHHDHDDCEHGGHGHHHDEHEHHDHGDHAHAKHHHEEVHTEL